MKKYLLFCGDNYYPLGGWSDFKGSFDSQEEAEKAAIHKGWFHIVDKETWEIVKKYDSNP